MAKPDVVVGEETLKNAPPYDYASEANGKQLGYSQKDLQKAILKLDFFLLPLLTLLYLANFIDRSNFGNARIAGLQKDLGMTDHDYSVALTVTYVPYIFIELPIVLSLDRLGPHRVIPFICTAWGIVTCFQGFVHTYSGLLAARFFLGLTEGGILPAIVLTFSTFYTRHQLQLRLSLLFSALSLGGAFSGLLAAAILNLDGRGGKRGWQWIFIIEGAATVVLGVACFFLLPRNIGSTRYLTSEQREALQEAHRQDSAGEGHDAHPPFSFREAATALYHPHTLLTFVGLFCSGTTLYGLAYFSPSIVKAMGYSAVRANLMSVPPYACSAAFSIIVAIISDRYKARGLSIIFAACVAIAGFATNWALINQKDYWGRYAALIIQTMGVYTVVPTLSTWMPNNIRPYGKRAMGVGMAFIASNAGGITSVWLFTTPPYKKAVIVNLFLTVVNIIAAAANVFWLASRNRKKQLLAEKYVPTGEEHLLDDSAPDFKYTL